MAGEAEEVGEEEVEEVCMGKGVAAVQDVEEGVALARLEAVWKAVG